jgi:hypothetical protein
VSEHEKEIAYRSYSCDMLLAILGSLVGDNVKQVKRYYDLINDEPKEEKTAEELVAEFSKKTGIEVI